jgi:hypothetical protein
MEKKEIPIKTSVKAIINGFVSYGIILGFLFTLLIFLFEQLISSLVSFNNLGLTAVLSLITAILLYFLVHGICRLSTYDVFKKCKTNPENINSISQKLNAFFLICIIVSVVISVSSALIKLNFIYQSIEDSKYQYGQVFSSSFTEQLTNEMLTEYSETKTSLLISTIIVELGFVISTFSLIPYQKKMITLYNKYEVEAK